MNSTINADVAAISANRAVPTVLQMVAELTGLRFACVARVTETSWTACAVLDSINFGLKPGDEIDVATTFCHQIRDDRKAMAIDQVSASPAYRDHITPKLYGFESYIALPLYRANGEYFGTLCALDPLPHPVSTPRTMRSMTLLAHLLAQQIEAAPPPGLMAGDLVKAAAAVALGDDFTLSFKPADGLAGDLRQVVASLAGVRPVRVIDTCFDLGDAAIVCDRKRIAQLLATLLASALAHGGAAEPVLLRCVADADTLHIEVNSMGPQLPAAAQAQLFHLYRRPLSRLRGNDAVRDGSDLYLAAEIARAHGGTLTCTSGEHTTTFTFSMPLTIGIAPL